MTSSAEHPQEISPEQLRLLIETVFGAEHSITHRVGQIAESLRQDLAQIPDQDDVIRVVIHGGAGSAREWLATCFFNERPVDGFDTAGETAVRWFGPNRPVEASDQSSFQRIAESTLIDLGSTYTLGIAPASDYYDQTVQNCARKAAIGASINIVVIDRESLRAMESFFFIQDAEGLPILPVVCFDPLGDHSMPDESERVEIESYFENNWRKHSESKVLPPVFLPNPKLFSEGDEACRDIVRHRIKGQLQNKLTSAGAEVDRAQQTRIHLRKAKDKVRSLLEGEFPQIHGPLEDLKSFEQLIPNKVLELVLGSDRAVNAGLRKEFRMDLIERSPSWFFPMRAMDTLLARTRGAWDSFLIAMTGSIPSLAKVLFTAGKNLHEEQGLEDAHFHALKIRLEQLLEDEARSYIWRIEELSGEGPEVHSQFDTSVAVHGMRLLVEDAEEVKVNAVENGRSRFLPVLLAILGMAVFWALLSPLLRSIYQEYIQVGWSIWMSEKVEKNWQDLPVLPLRQVGSTLLLCALPAFLISMVRMSYCCRSKHIAGVRKQIQEQLREAVILRLSDGSFRIQIKNPKIESLRKLL